MIEAGMKPFREQTYYELLEVAPDASVEQIREAYERAVEQLGPDSVAIYSLAEPGQAEELLALLERAVQTLSDPDLRRGYDRAIGLDPSQVPAIRARTERSAPQMHSTHPDVSVAYVPAGEAQRPRPPQIARPPDLSSAPQLAEEVALASAQPPKGAPEKPGPKVSPKPKPVAISEASEINGELLRQIREAKGISLQQVADRTRIARVHLENVEADRYDALPAQVYLRGILMNLARELSLDPLKVAKGYLEVAAAKGKR